MNNVIELKNTKLFKIKEMLKASKPAKVPKCMRKVIDFKLPPYARLKK